MGTLRLSEEARAFFEFQTLFKWVSHTAHSERIGEIVSDVMWAAMVCIREEMIRSNA